MKREIEKYDYQCLNDAKDILTSIGMPPGLTRREQEIPRFYKRRDELR